MMIIALIASPDRLFFLLVQRSDPNTDVGGDGDAKDLGGSGDEYRFCERKRL